MDRDGVEARDGRIEDAVDELPGEPHVGRQVVRGESLGDDAVEPAQRLLEIVGGLSLVSPSPYAGTPSMKDVKPPRYVSAKKWIMGMADADGGIER